MAPTEATDAALSSLSPSAAAVLRLTSVLAPARVPLAVLQGSGDAPEPLPTGDALEEALAALAEQGAITRHDDAITVDPKWREKAASGLDEAEEWRSAAGALLIAALPEHLDVEPSMDSWWRIRSFLPHAEALVEGVELGHPRARDAAQLLLAVGWGRSSFGDGPAALDAYERASTLFEAFDPTSIDVSRSLQGIGAALIVSGRADEAAEPLEKAIEIRIEHEGEDDPSLVMLWFGLASAYIQQQRFKEAEALVTRSLHRSIALHGPDDPQVAGMHTALAEVYELLASEQRSAADEVLDDPDLETSWASVGALFTASMTTRLHADSDDYLGSSRIERALEMAETLGGPTHVLVGSLHAELGYVRRHNSDLSGAKESLQTALAHLNEGRDDDELGDDMLGTLEISFLTSLGSVLVELEEHEEARVAIEKALAVDASLPGDKRRVSASALDDLAAALGATGDVAGARARYEEATALERAEEDAYPYLLSITARQRAVALLRLGEVEGARGLLDQSIDFLEDDGESELLLREAVEEAAKAMLDHDQHAVALAYYERLLAMAQLDDYWRPDVEQAIAAIRERLDGGG